MYSRAPGERKSCREMKVCSNIIHFHRHFFASATNLVFMAFAAALARARIHIIIQSAEKPCMEARVCDMMLLMALNKHFCQDLGGNKIL